MFLPVLQLIDDALAAHPGLAHTLRKGIWRSNSSTLRGADGNGQAAAPGAASSSSSGSAGRARQGTGAAVSAQAAAQHADENCGQAAATAMETSAHRDGLEAAGVLQQVLEIAFSWLAFEMQVRASTHLTWRPPSGLSELLGACLVSACAAQHTLPALYTAGWCERQEPVVQGRDWTLCTSGLSSSVTESYMLVHSAHILPGLQRSSSDSSDRVQARLLTSPADPCTP